VHYVPGNYTPVDDDPKHSPLLWPGGHKNLPPHFIQCCGLDPLRDDALLYHRELLEQGVTSETIVYPGVPHGFDAAFAQIALGKKFAQDRSEGFASLLRR
jgi:acetyl esterase/lipase